MFSHESCVKKGFEIASTYYAKTIRQEREITVLINADTAEDAELMWGDSSATAVMIEDCPNWMWREINSIESEASLATEQDMEIGQHLSDVEAEV